MGFQSGNFWVQSSLIIFSFFSSWKQPFFLAAISKAVSSLVSDIQYAASSQMEELQLFPLEIIHTLIFSAVSYFLGLVFVLLLWLFFSIHTYISAHLTPNFFVLGQQQTLSGFVRCPRQMKISQLSQENKFPFCLQLPLGMKECSEYTLKS